MATLPPELWPPVIRRAASSLPDLARLSAITRATRALCWTSLRARQQFLTTILTDDRPAIEIFASDPKLLKNPRAFPDLPEFLAFLFSDSVWLEKYVVNDQVNSEGNHPLVPERRWDKDGSSKEEGLLERICGVEGDENEPWVRACLQAWPISIAERTAPNVGGKHRKSQWLQRHHFTKAIENLLCRGRVNLLPLMIGEIRGEAAWEAIFGRFNMVQIIAESKDPMLILTELLDRRACKLDEYDNASVIGVAAARGLVDVLKRFGRRLRHDLWIHQRVWQCFRDMKSFAINIETMKAVADLGIRIDANDFLTILTQRLRALPDSLDDEAVLTFIADNMYEPCTGFDPYRTPHWRMWPLIDRPRLRQQLIERRILPQEPACVTACLDTVHYAKREVGEAEMVELARRAVMQGARVTKGAFMSALCSGSADYARLAFETTSDHDLSQWRGTLDVWGRLATNRGLTVDICHLVLNAGFRISHDALLKLALETPWRDGDAAIRILKVVLNAAEPYRHEILRESCDMRLNWHPEQRAYIRGRRSRGEEDGLPEIVEMLLQFGFRPSRIGFLEGNSLPKTKKVVLEFLEENGLTIGDLSPLRFISRRWRPFRIPRRAEL
ncbi:hypothetical protein HK101_003017 [Irineochytrium annulatum]|nr:hypothetical protein HK101_003017 [Irineochytrium annulatum]